MRFIGFYIYLYVEDEIRFTFGHASHLWKEDLIELSTWYIVEVHCRHAQWGQLYKYEVLVYRVSEIFIVWIVLLDGI